MKYNNPLLVLIGCITLFSTTACSNSATSQPQGTPERELTSAAKLAPLPDEVKSPAQTTSPTPTPQSENSESSRSLDIPIDLFASYSDKAGNKYDISIDELVFTISEMTVETPEKPLDKYAEEDYWSATLTHAEGSEEFTFGGLQEPEMYLSLLLLYPAGTCQTLKQLASPPPGLNSTGREGLYSCWDEGDSGVLPLPVKNHSFGESDGLLREIDEVGGIPLEFYGTFDQESQLEVLSILASPSSVILAADAFDIRNVCPRWANADADVYLKDTALPSTCIVAKYDFPVSQPSSEPTASTEPESTSPDNQNSNSDPSSEEKLMVVEPELAKPTSGKVITPVTDFDGLGAGVLPPADPKYGCTVTYGSASEEINIRTDHTASANLLTTVPAGEVFEFEDCPNPGWVRAAYNGTQGWAYNGK